MAVLMRQTMPEGVTVDILDAVTEEMGVAQDPPAGLVVHVHFQRDGRTEIVDVWESEQAYETFSNERLMPAMQKVSEQRGLSAPPQGGGPEIVEVGSIIRGR